MPKVSSKRQITIPIALCKEAHINPGDEIEAFIYEGQITIVKKERGSAKGVLKNIKVNRSMSEELSLQDTLNKKR
ncbi:MAG: AbrB/MazE/SpoVT family DNA-binding domain-containing protein [Pseudomonadales bacterium]|nr:AbrB/MazE/SpoVT family DNA-binding domain-containing protein [Pseudomonadales bacterium]